MNRFLAVFIFFITFSFTFSQKVKVDFIIKNDSLPKREKKDFIYLDKLTDISRARYIGRLKVINKSDFINFAIFPLTEKAQKKGANSFKFVDFKSEDGLSEIVVDAYVIDDEIKTLNEGLRPKNKIYFFGKDNTEKESSEEYKLNGELKTLQSLHYSVIDFDVPMTINKGKVFGTTLNLKPPTDGRSAYINFAGFGAMATPGYGGAGVGVSFSGGSVFRMDPDYALFLLNIYQKQD